MNIDLIKKHMITLINFTHFFISNIYTFIIFMLLCLIDFQFFKYFRVPFKKQIFDFSYVLLTFEIFNLMHKCIVKNIKI